MYNNKNSAALARYRECTVLQHWLVWSFSVSKTTRNNFPNINYGIRTQRIIAFEKGWSRGQLVIHEVTWTIVYAFELKYLRWLHQIPYTTPSVNQSQLRFPLQAWYLAIPPTHCVGFNKTPISWIHKLAFHLLTPERIKTLDSKECNICISSPSPWRSFS